VTECGDRAIEGGAYIADIAAKRDERLSHHSGVPVPRIAMRGRHAPVPTSETLTSAHDGDPDIGKGRRDRRVGLVDRDPDPCNPWEALEDGGGDRAGRGLDQPIAAGAEGLGGDLHDLIVAHGVRKLVGARRFRQVGVEDEVETEGLSDPALVLHDAVIGMEGQPGDKHGVGHRAPRMAAAMRSACTVSGTSWVRMIAAPPAAARRWAAIDPPRRWSGEAGETLSMQRLRDAPTRSGSPKDLSSESRAMAVTLCSGVLPKPMPGSSTMLSRAMPARAAISSEREKKAAMSAIMSIAGSAACRLCMMITGTPCSATTRAMSPSRCRPHTSLTIAAPDASAQAATLAFMMSAPPATIRSACPIAIVGSRKRPPSEKESGVTLSTPMTAGRPSASRRAS